MHEKIKLLEAEYFLNQMMALQSDYFKFTFNLSAFLSATRSVLYFMREELQGSRNQPWFDNKMNSTDILKFFKSTRDLNIHIRPCRPAKDVRVMVPVTTITTTLNGVAISSSGQIVYTRQSPISPTEIPQAELFHNYRFDEAFFDQTSAQYTNDDKILCKRLFKQYDVLTFCSEYFKELTAIVDEGISKKYISG
jgi:hypothetical protein